MKICLLSFHCCPFSQIGSEGVGGMNVYIKELCAALAELPDVTIDIFTRRQSQYHRDIKERAPPLRVIHLKGGPEKPVNRRELYEYLPEFIENAVEFILKTGKKYDLVYSHYWLSGLAGEWIKYRFNLPLAHTYHTLGFLKNRVLEGKEHPYRNAAERHLAGVADAIISSSLEEKDNLIRTFQVPDEKLQVIYPGVNKDLFCPLPEEQHPACTKADSCLLYVGRIEPVKGILDVIEAMFILKNKAPELFSRICLKVIGGGKEKEMQTNPEIMRIHELLDQYGIEDRVRFLGSIPQEELKGFYSAAEALVVPSLYESFGLVVVEALACGTPVLVSKIGKMQTIVKDGHTGFSFRPNDPASLATCLQYFFAHKDSLWPAQKIRTDVIDRFSWKKTADGTYQVFTTILLRGETPRPV